MLGLQIAGAGLSAASAIAGGILGARERARQTRILKQQQRDNTVWYNRRYNEVGTERAAAKRALTAMRDAQTQRVSNARGRAAVMGAGGAVVAQEKESANNAMGNTIATINAQNEQNKRTIEDKYLQNKTNLENAMQNVHNNTANNIAQAATGAVNAGINMFALGYGNDVTKQKQTPNV